VSVRGVLFNDRDARDLIADVSSSTLLWIFRIASRILLRCEFDDRDRRTKGAINVATGGRRGVCIYRSPRRQLLDGAERRAGRGMRLLIMPLPRRKLQRLAIRFFSFGPREASVSFSARARARNSRRAGISTAARISAIPSHISYESTGLIS